MPSSKTRLTFGDMLQEIRADGLSYDSGTDTARLKAPGATGKGRLGLLDAQGFLVGVDLRADDPRGSVVMLGPHEAVAETRKISARVEGDDVVIERAGAQIRAGDASPYGAASSAP